MRKRWERDAGLRLDQILLSARPARAPGRGRRRSRRARPGRTPATMPRCGWCCAMAASRSRRPARPRASRRAPPAAPAVQRSKPAAKAKERRPLLVIDGDFVRAPRLSRAAEDASCARGNKPAGAILGFANFLLKFYQSEAAARRAGGLGHARRGDLPARSFPRLPERTRIRRCARRAARHPAGAGGRLRLRERQEGGLRGRRFPRRRGDARGTARRHRAGRERRPRHLPARLGGDDHPLSGACRRGRAHHARPRSARATASTRRRCPTSSRCAAIPRTSSRARKNIGPQGAADVLRRHGSLEGALAAGRFATQAKELRLYRSIATMDRKAPLPPLPDQTPTWSKASALARTWQLNQLADRFAKMVVAFRLPASPTSPVPGSGR